MLTRTERIAKATERALEGRTICQAIIRCENRPTTDPEWRRDMVRLASWEHRLATLKRMA